MRSLHLAVFAYPPLDNVCMIKSLICRSTILAVVFQLFNPLPNLNQIQLFDLCLLDQQGIPLLFLLDQAFIPLSFSHLLVVLKDGQTPACNCCYCFA